MNLVTGGTGFLGAHVVAKLLEAGESVRVLIREGASLDEFNMILSCYFNEKADYWGRVEWVTGDLLDIYSLEDALEHVDTVYHCAALVSMEPSRAREMMKVNGEGTANLVNACLHVGDIRFCYLSSIAALGRASATGTITEESNWVRSKGNSAYAISKYSAEMEVWRGIEEGLNAVILNPGVIVGTGAWHKGSPSLFALIAKGFPFYSDGVTGYVDVQDVAKAALALAKSPIQAERFILVAENLSYQEYFNMIADAAGAKRPSVRVNRFLSRIAWRYFWLRALLSGKAPIITRDTARASQEKHFYSSEKMLHEFDFVFTPILETVKRTANDYSS